MANKLGDMPTMRVEATMLQNYARELDAQARGGRLRMASAPEIQITVEYMDELPTAVRNQSTLRPVQRSIGGTSLEVVPVISVAREDLTWFELEADAMAVLAMVDGCTTLQEIVSALPMAPERTVELIRGLEQQRVITLG